MVVLAFIGCDNRLKVMGRPLHVLSDSAAWVRAFVVASAKKKLRALSVSIFETPTHFLRNSNSFPKKHVQRQRKNLSEKPSSPECLLFPYHMDRLEMQRKRLLLIGSKTRMSWSLIL